MAKEKWVVMTKKADFEAMAKRFKISPMLARIIRNRDVISLEEVDYYLNGTPQQMHDPGRMKDMEKGAQILISAIRDGKKIRVIGDYDADGVCASYILKKGITELGGDVSVTIPHRVTDGYGLNMRLVEEAYKDGMDVIVTCDNGIAACDEIAFAKSMGMTVVVTDHHEIPYEETEDGRREVLPPADAVINPKQGACEYPFQEICGALVAYKLVQMICQLEQKEDEQLLSELLEFAAIATVCDVMDLLDENRIVVKYGLKRLSHSANPGLRKLIEVCGLSEREIGCYHVGFILGPCLNATGRLDTAMQALELFDAEDERDCTAIAITLKEMNDQRKNMTEQGVESAIRQVEKNGYTENQVLVVYLPDCHESIAGIIAGRLKEMYYRPVFVLTDGEDGLKGSGRSIEAYSMYDKLCEVKDLLEKFGGHKMAAGLSVKPENLEQLRSRLNKNADLTEQDLTAKVRIDIPMPMVYASREFAQELQKLEPFGTGNRKPMFAERNVRLRNCTVHGRHRNVAKFTLDDESGYRVSGVYFGDADMFMQEVNQHNGYVNVVYYPELNEYKKNVSLQIVVSHYGFSD